MAKVLQLKVNRTFKHPVKVAYYDEDGKLQKDEFIGVFKMPTNDNIEGKMVIDQLISVENLNMIDDNGEALKGDELLDAVRNDSDIADAVYFAWREAMEKKTLKPRISSKSSAT